MTKETPSHAPPSGAFAVFIDTTLDTHLAMVVPPNDTVGDLKGKIRTEHTHCFPNMGEITVQSIKARRKGSFYHLCDSMHVQSVFHGTKGTRFLYMDAVSAGDQVELTKDKMNYPLTCLHMLSVHDSVPLPHAGSSPNNHPLSDNPNVDASILVNSSAAGLCGDHSMLPTEHVKKPDLDEPEQQVPVCVGDIAVESLIQPGTGHVISQDEKDAGGKDSDNIVAKANTEMVSTKKEKSRKRSSSAFTDRLVDKDSLLAENKRHKGNDDPCAEPVDDPAANFGSCIHSKEVHNSENVHPESITPLQDDPSQKDLIVDGKKKTRKRKKEVSSKLKNDINSANSQSRQTDTSAVRSVENQDAEENPQDTFTKNCKALGEETDPSTLSDKATINVADRNSLELGSLDPLSFNLQGLNCNTRLLFDGSGNEYNKQGQVTDADPQSIPFDKKIDLINRFDAVTSLQDAAPQRHSAEHDTQVPNNSNHSKKKHKGGTSRNTHNSLSSSGYHVNEVNIEASGNNEKYLRTGSDIRSFHVEVGDHISHAEGNPEVPADPDVKGLQRTRRKKSHKIELVNPQPASAYEAVHPSRNQVPETSLKELSDDQFKGPHKKSKGLTDGEAAILGTHAADDSGVPPNTNNRNSRRKRKTLTKLELANHNSIDKEHTQSFSKEATKESRREKMEDNNKEQVEKSQSAATTGETGVGEISASGNSTFHASHNDRMLLHRRKKSTKGELPNGDSANRDDRDAHLLVKVITEESPAETFEDSCREQSANPKSTSIITEAENHEFKISTLPSNSNDRHTRQKKKKTSKLTNHDFIGKEPIECIDSLAKEGTKEKPIATRGSPAEINLANVSENSDSSHMKKKAKADLSDYLTSNDDLNHSKGKRSPWRNLDKALGTTIIDGVNGSNLGTAPDETIYDRVHGNHVDAQLSAIPIDSANKQDIVQHSAKEVAEENTKGLLGNYSESSGRETAHKERSAEFIEANSHMELSKSDTYQINFVEFFVPKAVGLQSHGLTKERSSMETESRIINEEKTKRRKRKANVHTEDPTHDLANPSSLNELKKKPQDDDPGNLDLVDLLVPLPGKEPKTKRGYNKKTEGRTSGLGIVYKLGNNKIEQKHHVSNSGTHHQVSLWKDDQSKNLKGKNSAVTKRKLKPIPGHEDRENLDSTDGDRQPTSFDASIRSSPVAKPATQNHSSVCAEIPLKKIVQDLSASSDSTEENTPSRKYRVAVRNAPSSKFGKKLRDDGQEKTMSSTPGTIFDDATSESSDDGFEVYNRKSTSKTVYDNSSTSEDSDAGLEGTQKGTDLKARAYVNSPGAPSDVYAENAEETDEIVLSQTKVKRSMPLSSILRSTSSYRKAKLTSSQSQVEDSESLPVEVVPESQPDLA